MTSHPQSPHRNRRSYSGIPGQPDDSPPPSLRALRLSAMPQPQPDIQHPALSNPSPPSYPPQKRSPPATQPTAQNFVSAQYHPPSDKNTDHSQTPPQQQQPPAPAFPRPVQRVPPPPLLAPDAHFNPLRDEWTMSDQLLAEIDRAAQGQDAPHILPKGPMIERERARERRDSPRDGSGGSGGSGGPRTPPHTLPASAGPQRPLPVVPDRPAVVRRASSSRESERDRESPTYYSPLTTPPAETHHRDASPPVQYDERRPPSKARTPDRSLPVQEENEVEEDVTITPASEREREREREREKREREIDFEIAMERERERERERDRERDTKDRARQIEHRLPTPQFTSSPMLPPPPAPGSDVELSTTVQGDDYQQDYHDGRSSRTAHRFDDEQEQDDTESYTPRSHHAPLPPPNGAHPVFRPRTASSDGAGLASIDTAMLRDAIEKLQGPHADHTHHTPDHAAHNNGHHAPEHGAHHHYAPDQQPYGAHTAYPARMPTADELRALVADPRAYEAWHAAAAAAMHVRPGAPVPPTPPNAAQSFAQSFAHPAQSFAQSFSPPPLRSTPYPYSYQHPGAVNRSPDPHQWAQLQQLQQLQLLGMQTDSTFSPSATPYPAYDYSPFLADHLRRRGGGGETSMSLRSSPSHMPVALPAYTVRRVRGSRALARGLPPRGESTEPRETSPESSDGEGGEGEEAAFDELAAHLDASGSSESATAQQLPPGGDDAEWVDEDSGDEDDLLHLEYHPSFVAHPAKRRKRSAARWGALVKAFQALDRETDATLLLLAAPAHSTSLHAVRSRALRRLPPAPELNALQTSFAALSARRRAAPRPAPLADYGAGGSADELRGALGAALRSLSALSGIYEGREQRWRAEMGRMGEERERVEVLLRQALGMGLGPGVL